MCVRVSLVNLLSDVVWLACRYHCLCMRVIAIYCVCFGCD